MTHKLDRQVEEFHRALGLPVGDIPHMIDHERQELRVRLIQEEFAELQESFLAEDLEGAIDAIVDLLYVTYGTAVEMGVDVEPFADAVHDANMLKAGGPIRADGKVLKPEGWDAPDIAGVLRRVMERGG